MNKVEMIEAMAQSTGFTKKDAEKAINAFTEVVTAALVTGDSVKLVGFGTFEVKEHAPRQARNPKTGETFVTKATRAPHFKISKALKDAVKG